MNPEQLQKSGAITKMRSNFGNPEKLQKSGASSRNSEEDLEIQSKLQKSMATSEIQSKVWKFGANWGHCCLLDHVSHLANQAKEEATSSRFRKTEAPFFATTSMFFSYT